MIKCTARAHSNAHYSKMDGPNMMTCAICLEYFKDPSTIPCGHNFCLACINLHWDRQSKQGTSLDCPKCKQDFPSRPQLCRNMDLKELVEGVGSSGLYSAEVVAAMADGGSDAPRDRPPCHRHGKPVVFFCNRDKMAVCCECVVKECAQHDKSMLEEERQNQEMILQKKEKDIERLIAETEKSLEDLSENIDQAKVNLQQTSNWVSTKFSSFIKSLVQKQEATERFMEEQSHSTMADAQSRHSQLEERVRRLQENQEQIQALRGLSDTQLIQESRFVKVPQFQDISTEVNPGLQERLSTVTDVLTRVSKLLHEDLERAVGTALADRQGSPQDKRPILAVVPSPAAPFVPGLREGLDTYRCALTFDPCTANANLSLSHGNTRVEHLTSGPRLLPPDEARFDHTWQVMCSQGFQRGVHYWEMDVSKPWAFVGVTYESIPRKEKGPRCMVGRNEMSWSLQLDEKQLSAWHGGRRELVNAPTPPPCRIGVLLDYDTGTLTFSGPHQSRLHAFHCAFTHPLYPACWVGEGVSVRLCSSAT